MIFAQSKAGHDKDEIYYVYAEEDADVILVNGKNRTIEYPKKKRKKHVQPINSAVDQELLKALQGGTARDEQIKYAIRQHGLNQKAEPRS